MKYTKYQTLLGRIDKHFEGFIDQSTYKVTYIKPSKLITFNRLDLAIKILYLRMRDYIDVHFAAELYEKHIKAFSLGSFTEPGKPKKNSIQHYFNDFQAIYKSISIDGFKEAKSVIPLSSSGSIANGAHRLASAYEMKKVVPSVSLNMPDDNYDFNFFLQRGMSIKDVETAVTSFIEFADNCYVALIWPSAKGNKEEVDNLIPNIVYQKSVALNNLGAHNLLTQVYFDEDWLGSREDKYPGVKDKLVECFKTFDDLRVVAFQSNSLEEVLLIKEHIREIFSIGKHSVHITDTKDEAIRTARILFNENSIHFLNYGNPTKFLSVHQKIERFKKFIEKNDIDIDKTVLDSSIVMSLYGIRESNDIDYLSVDEDVKYHDELIDNHVEELVFHQESKNSLIFNQALHFYYDGLKFISFSQLYNMKKNRSEKKDQNDLVLMKSLIEHNLMRMCIGKCKQEYYFFTVKLRIKVMKLLKHIGLYKTIRYIYRVFKK